VKQAEYSINEATADQIADMCDVYAHHVQYGTGSFEEVPPTVDEIRQRWQQRESRNQPTLVAYTGRQFAGFAYAASHKERSAYRFTVEDSIYIAPAFMGQGVGSVLLENLMALCTERGFRQMIAVIGDSANLGSIRVHESCGFRQVGMARDIGYKFDRWLDIVYMQRSLR